MTHAADAPAADRAGPVPGARGALLLLILINLFNYIDRQILSATLPKIKRDAGLFRPDDPYLNFKLGTLTTAFMVSYILAAPLFGRLGDRRSRWFLVGVGVVVWSLASGGTGLAPTFLALLLTRCLVGVGEAAYGPVAPSMISDMYPVRDRGYALSWFYMAIPVGSALGFVLGGQIAEAMEGVRPGFGGWRWTFLAVVPPGLVLGGLCLFREDRRPPAAAGQTPVTYGAVMRLLARNRSWVLDTAGMTAMTFALGGVAVWMPEYIFQREARFVMTDKAVAELRAETFSDGTPAVPEAVVAKLARLTDGERLFEIDAWHQHLSEALTEAELRQYRGTIDDHTAAEGTLSLGKITFYFGVIVVVAGLGATLLGGLAGDRLRDRYPGSYFLVAGAAMLVSFPLFLLVLFVPFPWAWGLIFLAVFGLFFNTGPTNTILANVTHSSVRARGFAINILVIHILGDAISPAVIGWVADVASLNAAFLMVSVFILAGGVLWLMGAPYLAEDTRRAEAGTGLAP